MIKNPTFIAFCYYNQVKEYENQVAKYDSKIYS